jgi:hypothetical protein
MRPFVEHAVENVLDAHDAIENVLGPLRLLAWCPAVGTPARQLTVWAPLYQTEDGVREVRRLRIGEAREPDDEDGVRWAATAGYVAATAPGRIPPTRVRVVEVGCVDGSITVVFDGTPEDARAWYVAVAKDRAAALTVEDHVVPGSCCGDCKGAGSCAALVPLDGLLGQRERGHRSRSVSPTELQQYARCPAQWLFERVARLPKEVTGSDTAARGRAVHAWLGAAHARGTGCRPADLPPPGGPLGLAEGVLDAYDYALAYPFLRRHVDSCALSDPDVVPVAVEEAVRGFDHDAQVVPVARPDLMYRRSAVLVIREVKTSETPFGQGRDEAFDRYVQIPFMLRMLEAGLLAAHDCSDGIVELELLTPDEQFLWTWSTAEPLDVGLAAAELERIVDDWHHDSTWRTMPGPHCQWCRVRRWCPDRDVYQAGAGSRTGDAPRVGWTGDAADVPPF